MKNFTLFLFLASAVFYLSSNSGGPTTPSGDRTGSPVADGTCGSCHNGGSFAPETTITLTQGGETVTSYRPGEEYMLNISVATSSAPSGYGFQAVVLSANNDNAGSFGTAPSDFKVTSRNNREYLEHSTRQTSETVSIPWTAPAVGTGDVTVYAAGNAINSNGGTSGDQVDEGVLTVTEQDVSSSRELFARDTWQARLTASSLLLQLPDATAPVLQAQLLDLNGRVLQTERVNSTQVELSLRQVSPQVAVVRLLDAEGFQASKMVVRQ